MASNYFHDEVDTGTTVLAKAPRGKFFLDPKAGTPAVLLSAGVGLTPLTSMLNAIVGVGSGRETWFIHGARNKGEHAFSEHHRRVNKQNKNVHMHVRYSQPSPEDVLGSDYDDQGHVEIQLIKRLVPHKECDFYLCGPSPFMESLFGGLLEWGVHETRIHYEFFGPASVLQQRGKVSTPKRAAETTQCCEEIEVHFSKSRVKVNWNPSFESILDLAEANGLTPDYSCRSGICHTCLSRLEEGEVEYVQDHWIPQIQNRY